ncbi:MAG: response regulator [Gammaproteobacteria bacterium]|nr:response regulator [Gammaproteobacteria bacterium]
MNHFPAQHSLEQPTTGRLNVLLLEDDPGFAFLVTAYLGDTGVYTIEHVTTLHAACNKLENALFDVVLMDMHVPDACGVEIVERIHKLNPSMLSIVISGLDDQALALRTLEAGADEYVIKENALPKKLHSIISLALERHRFRAQTHLLLDINPDGLIVLDNNHCVIEANKSALRLINKKIQAMIGQPLPVPTSLLNTHQQTINDRILEISTRNIFWYGKSCYLVRLHEIIQRK